MAKDYLSVINYQGIDQSKDETLIDSRYSPFAQNMVTDDSTLAVAAGYEKYIAAPIPGEGSIKRIGKYQGTDGSEVIVAIAGDSIYAYLNDEWQSVYTYAAETGDSWDFINGMIGSKGYLFIANGQAKMVKFDGSTVTEFGTDKLKSNVAWNYLTIYKDRLFAAGAKIVDPENEKPNRLWYSRAYTLNDFTGYDSSNKEDSPAKAGGFIDIGSAQSDRIIAIRYVFERVLIFCTSSTWYLYGTDPSNFVVNRIDSEVQMLTHTGIVKHADKIYYLTQSGVYYFGGSALLPMPSARYTSRIMNGADMLTSKACSFKDKLYFSFKSKAGIPTDDSMIVYDTMRGTYMLRNGFNVIDMFSDSKGFYLVNENRYVYAFEKGTDYDGVPIHAIWETPELNIQSLFARQSLREIYLRGYAEDVAGKVMVITQYTNGRPFVKKITLYPENKYEVSKRPPLSKGQIIKFRLENENGGWWRLIAFEVHFETDSTKT